MDGRQGLGVADVDADAPHLIWPPDYEKVARYRAELRVSQWLALANKLTLDGLRDYYQHRPASWIEHFCITYDPRVIGTYDKDGKPRTGIMPFVLFPRQREFVEFLYCCMMEEQNGLVEKSRDVGATWLCCAFSVWAWLYWPGMAIGWGSREADLVDKLGDPSSIFEKMRMIVRNLPPEMLPRGYRSRDHSLAMRLINPATGATIVGETGDNIGRGGRTRMYFKDESAHYKRPDLIEASLMANTRVQIDISSVNGVGNPFYNKREAGIDWSPGKDIPRGFTRVFVFDWSDHPEKTQEWYQREREQKRREGMLHKFKQEVDRDYSGAVVGTIIPREYVEAAVDAHIKLGWPSGGNWHGGLDPADGGGDLDGLAIREGVVLRYVEEENFGDTGKLTRWTVGYVKDHAIPAITLEYDATGVGAGVKSEANRLAEVGQLPKVIRFSAWNGGAKPLYPERRMIPGDKRSLLNKNFYHNLKAQGWWQLRLRFERTYKAVVFGEKFDPDEMISIPSTLPNLRQLKKELSQPTQSKTPTMKLQIDKKPDGTRSPNLADAVMMCYWPNMDHAQMPDVPDALLRAFSRPPGAHGALMR